MHTSRDPSQAFLQQEYPGICSDLWMFHRLYTYVHKAYGLCVELLFGIIVGSSGLMAIFDLLKSKT